MKITAIDFETANRNPASVCAVGISTYEEGAVEERYYSLIRPEEDVFYFDPWNIRIHGIRPRDVLDAPDFETVYRHIYEEMEDALVVAHNAPFDMGCLKAACINCGIKVPRLRYFDTVELSRRLFTSMPHHRLNDMCDALNIELNHHNAASDAMGCLMIVVRVMEKSGIYDVEELLDKAHVRIRELRP
ncbi:MAG: 3'-5' exonuclease [Solobacterium sp.]|nr:3'-5' exonuclease [Solobacterium sp.]